MRLFLNTQAVVFLYDSSSWLIHYPFLHEFYKSYLMIEMRIIILSDNQDYTNTEKWGR